MILGWSASIQNPIPSRTESDSLSYTNLQESMKFRQFFVFLLFVVSLSLFAFCEGTTLWKQSRYDEFEKGTAKGIAIRSDGRLELAPSFKQVFTSPSTYIWQVVSDQQGNAYLASGSPARVYRVTPDGRASIVFEAKELQVQALAIDDQGALYAATSPDGKVYKIARSGQNDLGRNKNDKKQGPGNQAEASSDQGKSSVQEPKSEVPVDSAYRSSVFFDPKTKYVWDLAFDPGSGRLYVATGDHGEIYKVEKDGQSSLFFKSDESHIRTLALQPAGKSAESSDDRRRKSSAPATQSNVIAGSDGSGLIYRISPAGDAFVLYSANKKEITALVVDDAGDIYAAGVGDKRTQGNPPATSPLPITMPQNPQQPPGTPAAAPAPSPQPINIPAATTGGGSEIYLIASDGTPKRVWSSREDLVYALALQKDVLLAGTGNRGRVFAIGRSGNEDLYTDLVKASANQVTSFAAVPGGGLYASSSNLGKLFLIGAAPDSEGTFESDVFDARIFSRWGRPEVRGSGNFDFYARSGNVDNPDRNWSSWNKVNLSRNEPIAVPDARFMQWKVALHPGNPAASISSVGINYRAKNVAPVIEDIAVQVGARFGSAGKPSSGGETVMVGFGPNSTTGGAPIAATKDRDYIAVRWAVHDENDDDLVYSVYYRGDNETNWKLLKDNIREKQYSWDSSLLPDGGYTVKIVASDAPSHTPEEALTDDRESARFEVDSTPPRIESLQAKVEGEEVHVTFRASDTFSPIRRAEYSVDAGDWQVIEPVGLLSDSKTENYDFNILLPKGTAGETQQELRNGKKKTRATAKSDDGESHASAMTEHVVVVRVYDRFDNMSSMKTVTAQR
jgi:hypothetical protein